LLITFIMAQFDCAFASSQAPAPALSPASSRAAKRLRQHENRRLGRAEVLANQGVAPRQAAMQSFSDRFQQKVMAASEQLTLVVKNSFVDVEDSVDIEADMVCASAKDFQLPPAFLETTPEFDEWRLAYRRFRLGYHKGASGEAKAPRTLIGVFAADDSSDESSETEWSSECSADPLKSPLSSAGTDSTSASLDSLPPSPSSASSEAGCPPPASSSRAAKRQRQRERRRMGKAEAKAAAAAGAVDGEDAADDDEDLENDEYVYSAYDAAAMSQYVNYAAACGYGAWPYMFPNTMMCAAI